MSASRSFETYLLPVATCSNAAGRCGPFGAADEATVSLARHDHLPSAENLSHLSTSSFHAVHQGIGSRPVACGRDGNSIPKLQMGCNFSCVSIRAAENPRYTPTSRGIMG